MKTDWKTFSDFATITESDVNKDKCVNKHLNVSISTWKWMMMCFNIRSGWISWSHEIRLKCQSHRIRLRECFIESSILFLKADVKGKRVSLFLNYWTLRRLFLTFVVPSWSLFTSFLPSSWKLLWNRRFWSLHRKKVLVMVSKWSDSLQCVWLSRLLNHFELSKRSSCRKII